MTFYTPDFQKSNPSERAHRRAVFAHQACREAFRGRDLSLAREPEFIDRPPNRKPERLDVIVERIVENLLTIGGC